MEGQAAPKVDDGERSRKNLIKGATGFVETRDQLKITNTVIPGTTIPNMDADEETAAIQRLSAYVSLARNISLAVALVMALSLIPLLLLRRRAKLTAATRPPARRRPPPSRNSGGRNGFNGWSIWPAPTPIVPPPCSG